MGHNSTQSTRCVKTLPLPISGEEQHFQSPVQLFALLWLTSKDSKRKMIKFNDSHQSSIPPSEQRLVNSCEHVPQGKLWEGSAGGATVTSSMPGIWEPPDQQ